MGTPIPQNSFTAGELSPQVYGRTDFAKYFTGLRTCLNFIVRQYGGVENRPGSQLVAPLNNQTKRARLIPFVFSPDQQYLLEVGHLYIRIIYNGGVVVDGGGNPIVVTTPFTSSDLRTMTDIDLVKYVQSADIMTLCCQNYQPKQFERLSSTSWTLADFVNTEGPFQEINIDATKTMKANGAIGTVTITSNFDIFTAGNIGQLLYIESMPDFTTVAWEVQQATAVNAIVRAGANWYQAQNAATTGTVKPTTNIPGDVDSDGTTGVHWLYLHSGYGIVKITAVTDARSATATVIRRLPDLLTTGGVPRTITNVITGHDASPGPPVVTLLYALVTCPGHGLTDGQTVTIAGVTGAVEVNGTHQVAVIGPNNFYVTDVTTTGTYTGGGTVTYTNTSVSDSYKWAFEAWKNDQGYPMSVGYFQQRQMFAASTKKPQTLWASQVDGYNSFQTNIPLLDDDAITLPIFSRRMNEIRHIIDLDSLILFTSDGPFVINGGQSAQNAIFSPSTISAKRQGANGVSHVPPLLINEQALFVQEKGSQVRSLGYNFQTDKYIGNDLTILSNHLFVNHSIVDWTFQEIPYACVWAVRDDGVLLGLTYLLEQQVVGWHQHVTDGIYESVCCISENNVDVLYAVVKRTVNGMAMRYIERFDDRQFADIRDAFFVDCGLTYDGRDAGAALTWILAGGTNWDYTESLTFTTSAAWFVGASDVGDAMVVYDSTGEMLKLTIIVYVSSTVVTVHPSRTVPAEFQGAQKTGFDMARNTFAGLSHLEGKTVAILADGFDCTPQVVTGGLVNLEYPAVVVHVGLPYVSDFETLDITDQGKDIRANQKRINRVSLVLLDSLGVMAGPDADHLTEYKQRVDEFYDDQTTPLTGITDSISIPADWNKPGRIFVRQDRPLPLSILAAIPEVDLGGV